MPKSGEHDVQTAPRLVAASIADDRLGQIGQKARDAIAWTYAQVAQTGCDARHFVPKLLARHRAALRRAR